MIEHRCWREFMLADVTQLLEALEQGDARASEQLLPVVYEELRKLAAARLANEPAGQTLQATALVHEAFVRLVDVKQQQEWSSRRHFFGAAAEAMRRILVENARRKQSLKRGGDGHNDYSARCDMTAEDIFTEALSYDSPEERKRFLRKRAVKTRTCERKSRPYWLPMKTRAVSWKSRRKNSCPTLLKRLRPCLLQPMIRQTQNCFPTTTGGRCSSRSTNQIVLGNWAIMRSSN